MSEVSAKKQLDRAILAAIKQLERATPRYRVTILKHPVFHIEAIRMTDNPTEVIRIHIVVGKPTDHDIKLVRDARLPEIFTKEIWARRTSGKGFNTIEI
jgi:hypothetical protein